jgi:hypothetical protein
VEHSAKSRTGQAAQGDCPAKSRFFASGKRTTFGDSLLDIPSGFPEIQHS